MGLNRTQTNKLDQESLRDMSSNGTGFNRTRSESGHLPADGQNARESKKNAADNGTKEEDDDSYRLDKDSDNDDDDDDDVKVENCRIKLMKHLKDKKRMKNYKVDNNKAYEDFVHEYADTPLIKNCIIDNGDNKERSLLHYMATRTDLRRNLHKAPFTFLIRLILKIDDDQYRSAGPSSNYKRILCVTSMKHYGANTCLHSALAQNQFKFAKYICRVAETSVLRQAIATPNSQGQTVLHLAITGSSSVDLELIRLLTENATADTFVMMRSKIGNMEKGEGNTPLHDFVSLQVPDDQMGHPDSEPQREEDAKTKWCDSYMEILRMMVNKGPSAMVVLNKASESPYMVHISTKPEIRPKVDIPAPKAATAGASGDGPQAEHQTSQEEGGKAGQIYDSSMGLANKVTAYLLEESLSQKTFGDTYTCLFRNQDGGPDTIFQAGRLSDKTTEIRQKLPLAHILACVELEIMFEPIKHSTEPSGQADIRLELERRGKERDVRVVHFFNWLRGKMKVQKIIKLRVEDDLDQPCSDEIIEQCLAGFDIRYLYWKKDDISVRSLTENCPNLRVLRASWCGRHSTLMGWLNKEHGVSQLPNLQELYISGRKGLESNERALKYLADFKKLLESRDDGGIKVDIQDFVDNISRSQDPDTVLHHPAKEKNAWIDEVDDFTKILMKEYSVRIRKQLNLKPIKVGVIDDGATLESLALPQVEGWSARNVPPEPRLGSTWHFSETGHGTEMVKLVQRVCPFASFFIGKINTRDKFGSSVSDLAVQAIEKAIDSGVNIICMSWTIYQRDDRENTKGLEDLTNTLKRAADQGILLYCAGQDEGEFERTQGEKKPYPASCNNERIKLIGSAGRFGRESEFVNIKNVQYLFPGEVASVKGTTTGSSVATALASGFAALILWCGEVYRAEEKGKALTSNVNDAIEEAAVMEDVDFQQGTRMADLFDELKTVRDTKTASIVNIKDLLEEATMRSKDNIARTLVMLCKERLRYAF